MLIGIIELIISSTPSANDVAVSCSGISCYRRVAKVTGKKRDIYISFITNMKDDVCHALTDRVAIHCAMVTFQ